VVYIILFSQFFKYHFNSLYVFFFSLLPGTHTHICLTLHPFPGPIFNLLYQHRTENPINFHHHFHFFHGHLVIRLLVPSSGGVQFAARVSDAQQSPAGRSSGAGLAWARTTESRCWYGRETKHN
jgi:hypothetical protein